MASLEFVYKHRFFVLLWSVLEILLFSATVYGWAALCVVLKEEDFFVELCERTDEGNSTCGSEKCDRFITKRLNLVFLTGVISFNATGIVSGAFLDRFGPRKTRLLSSILFGLSFIFLVLADKDRPDWIFPGIFTLSAAGITLLLPVFQVANMFEGSKSVVISLFNGAVDSSSVVLLFCKLVHDAGVSLHLIVIVYFIFAIISILMLTFILPPHSITLERLQDIPLPDNTNDEDEGSPLFEPKDGKEKGKNSNVQSTSWKSEKDPAPSLLSQMLAPEYIFTVLVLSGYSLRLWFYVGNLNSYLEFMSGNDKNTVSYYTNWFGIYQFTGFISAPFVGLPMDWKPKKKQDQETDIGFVAGYVLTSIIALILNILVLVPVLPAQYATFIMEVILRSFNYAVFTAFLIHKFPLVHFGKLYGVGHLISSIIGCLQYGLFTVVEDDLDKDPFWVNVSLLVMCLLLNIQPVFLWIKEKRQNQERLRVELIQG